LVKPKLVVTLLLHINKDLSEFWIIHLVKPKDIVTQCN